MASSLLSPHLLLLLLFLIPLFLTPIRCRETFSAEIEILSYEPADRKKTSSGECCVSSKSDSRPLNQTECAGQCVPFFKVCISDMETDDNSISPVELRTTTTTTTTTTTVVPRPQFPNRYPIRRFTTSHPRRKVARSASAVPASSKQQSSGIRSFWNRIYGTVASISKLMGSSTMDQTQEVYCSPLTQQAVDENGTSIFPISLRIRRIPKSLVSVGERSAPFSLIESSFPVTWRSSPRADPATKQGLLILEAWHKAFGYSSINLTEGEKLISRHAEAQDLQPGTEWEERLHNSTGFAALRFRWRLVPDDEAKLETTTSTSTTKQPDCPEGFTGSDCKDPVCAARCHPSRGYCQTPGECKCKFGWRGEDCSRCQKMPGCVHGLCVKPFECRCEEGWTGMFCDKPTCKLGCHPQNGFCELPAECRCRFGFKGENCSDCSTMPGCQRGSCAQPLDCLCDAGWRGLFCSMLESTTCSS